MNNINLSERVPTVKIRHKGQKEVFTINFSEYKPELHEMVTDEADLGPLKPLSKEEKESLIGSSVQPDSFVVDGKRVSLGKIVAAAHAKTGMSAAEWNALPNDDREGLIAAEVAATVPQEVTGLSVRHNGKRGNAKKWHVVDVNGELVDEQEFDNKEDADAHLETLKK